MNIDGSSLLSLFSSTESTESLEGLQQTLQLEGDVPEGFATVLMEKLTKLKNLQLDENFTINFSESESTLHGFADLLDEKTGIPGFTSFFGKNLPIGGKLESEIDLEDTMQALENVMNTLEDLVIEEEALKQTLSDEISLGEADGNLLSNQFSSLQANDAALSNNSSDLVKVKKEITENELQVEGQLDKTDEQKEELVMASQMAAIVATMDKPIETTDKQSLAAGHVSEIVNKKDPLVFKQGIEERALATTSENEDTDALLQQENAFRKSGQENSILTAKQAEKAEILDIVDLESSQGKVTPKFATDIANLNRAVMYDNKAEIPPMTKHFAHPEWNKEVGERVIWMHKQEIPSAELRLNPRHLGPVTIKIDVTQDQANISFIAQHATVKEAIEAAIPKLREMFSAQQLNLADVNVTQDDSSQKHSRGFDHMGNGSGKGGNDSKEMLENDVHNQAMDIAEEIEAGRAIASNGILSIFA